MKREEKKKDIVFVLFGSTGDLAVKKIFPALDSLFASGAFSDNSAIISVSRRDWDDSAFMAFLRERQPGLSSDFLRLVSYSKVDVEGGQGYGELKEKMDRLMKERSIKESYVYLSLAPQNHPLVVSRLKDTKILARGKSKILIEKPFGTDEKTAKSLDALLAFLPENQICRIDHYLGKDTVLAIMDLHESTADFDKLISAESVSSIHVRMFESKGIDGRGGSYDRVGAFRDVGQNHMLEMLAAVCSGVDGRDMWQKARAEVFTHLAPPQKTCESSRRGQYEGYHLEKGVEPRSMTETAFEVETHLSSGKLKGTPLLLESGKKMPASEVFIRIDFKKLEGLPRSMRFSIQPQQEITIENADGTIDSFVIPKRRDAYANIILSALKGSRREFVGREEIEALWRYTDHVVACWNKVPLQIYSEEKPFLLK